MTICPAHRFELAQHWRLRFLPLHFREKSVEFYGKRGINWHVTAVIRKTPECSLSVEVFVHVFDSCDTQNTLSTRSFSQLYDKGNELYFETGKENVCPVFVHFCPSSTVAIRTRSQWLQLPRTRCPHLENCTRS